MKIPIQTTAPHRSLPALLWNGALVRRAIRDAWLQLVVSWLLLTLFSWAFVWLLGYFDLLESDRFVRFLQGMVPGLARFVESLAGFDLELLTSATGKLSVLFVHVVTMLICVGWAIGQGSDPISGQITRGTMELIATLPVWRVAVVLVPAVVSTVGTAILVTGLLLGMQVGLAAVEIRQPVPLARMIPGAVNLFSMIFCLTGITSFISAWNKDRWRTIKLAGAFFLAEAIVEVLSRLTPEGGWLRYLTFLTLYQPQSLILVPGNTPGLFCWYNGLLVALGLLAYLATLVVFGRRDIPVPW